MNIKILKFRVRCARCYREVLHEIDRKGLIFLEKANSYYLLLTYLVLKKYTNENESLSAEEVATIIQREFRMAKKIDKRTIAMHFKRLEDLSNLAIDEKLSFFDEEVSIDNSEASVLHHFDSTEIKLLADIISFSKLVDQNYSYEMIEKIFSLGGQKVPYHYEEQLRYKFSTSRYNSQLFLSVEKVAEAIQCKSKVEVTYLKYDINQKLVPHLTKSGKERRVISPHSIIWNANFYYVLCTFEDSMKIYFLRADQMKDVIELEDEKVKPLPDDFNVHKYVQTQSHLFGGKLETFSFHAHKWLLNQIVDSFGAEAVIKEINNFEIKVELRSSYASMKVWLIQYITGITNIYPQQLKSDIKKTLVQKIEEL